MVALLYDVHGNLPALRAVLADCETRGVERFVLGGDYALFGAWPAECVARLRRLDARWIRGNTDRWLADPASAPDDAAVRGCIEACRELLGAEEVERLGALPATLTDGDTLFCHGSPRSDEEPVANVASEADADIFAGVTARRVVFGHTHVQFGRAASGIELVNPGSVGMPFDGDHRAAYAIVHDDGRVEPRRVRYDHEEAARAVRERLGEAGERPARRIEQASFFV